MISKEQVIEALKRVIDPEVKIDIWILGLIYEIEPEEEKVKIKMTLTSPMCPYGPQILADVKYQVGQIEGIKEVDIEFVFDPPWEPSEEVKLMLGVVM